MTPQSLSKNCAPFSTAQTEKNTGKISVSVDFRVSRISVI